MQLFDKIPGKVQGQDGIQQALTKRNKKKKNKTKKIGLSVSDFGMTVIKRISVITSLPFQKSLGRFAHPYVGVNVLRIMSSQWSCGRGFMALCFTRVSLQQT